MFLDETGLNIKMCRLYGRALKGKRCLSAVPHAHWHPATFIAALRHDRFTASFSTPSNAYGFWKHFPFLFGPPSSPLFPLKPSKFTSPLLFRSPKKLILLLTELLTCNIVNTAPFFLKLNL